MTENTEHLGTITLFRVTLRFPVVANDIKIFKNFNPVRFEATVKMHSLNKSLMVHRHHGEK